MKKVIKELIVVEGRHDTAALKRLFDCDTIETGGSSLAPSVMEQIKTAAAQRGVIIFTDPDAPGNLIRDRINREIPNCLNAFVQKKDARTSRKVGVEHAGKEILLEALEHLVTMTEQPEETITVQDFYRLGLTGRSNSSTLRERIGELYHIGYGSAKTMRHRLNCLGVTPEELQEKISNE